MEGEMKAKLHRLWRRFLLMDAPDEAYLEAIQSAHQAGEEVTATLRQFRHELDGVTFRVEKRKDVA